MLISDLIAAMERIAPPHLAEDWDNVGLLIGRPGAQLGGPVALTIDLTERVLEGAARAGARAIIAYHPPIFQAQRRLIDATDAPAAQRIAVRAIEAGIAVYSPHTALDAVPGGVTDWLADGLLGTPGAVGTGGDRRALRPYGQRDHSMEVKVVTFVPESHLEQVRGALASAGAGNIGAYELCSFATGGTGTFLGKAGTKPAVGQAGKLESAPELRLEMVCSRRSLALAIATLKQLHPYEEPAIDIYPLEPRPVRETGVGRRITLDRPTSLEDLADRLKRHLGVPKVHMASAAVDRHPLTRIGVVPGAGASVLPLAIAEQCEVFVTGEMKHHEVNAALAAGVSVMLGGHTATERGYLPVLASRLEKEMPGIRVIVSAEDKDPLTLR